MRIRFGALAVLLTVSACNGFVDEPAGSGGEPDEEAFSTGDSAVGEVFRVPANPLNVSLELASSSVTQTIGPDGGVIEVPLADGRVHSVEFEPATFLIDTEIVATLITGASGADGVDIETGLQLEPHGTVLANPATVSLELADPASSDLWAFSTLANGEQFYPTIGFAEGGRLEIPIIGFSSYEAGRATAEAVNSQLERSPVTSAGRRALGEMAVIFNQNPGMAIPEGLPDRVWDLLESWWENGIEPLAEEAVEDDVALMKLLYEAAWHNGVTQLLGTAEDSGMQRFADVAAFPIDRAIDRAIGRCKEEHRLGEIGYVLELEATRQLLGFAAEALDTDSIIAACARFRLVVESTITQEGSAQGVENESTSLVVGEIDPLYPLGALDPVLRSGFEFSIVGTGPLVYQVAEGTSSAEVGNGTCKATYTGGIDSEMMAVLQAVGQRPRRYGPWDVPEIYGKVEPPPDPLEPAETKLALDPGDPVEKATGSCPGFGESAVESATWDTLFAIRHVFDMVQGEDWAAVFGTTIDPEAILPEQTGFVLELDQFGGGRIYATGTWEGCDGGTATGGVSGETCERTFITLYHEPSP